MKIKFAPITFFLLLHIFSAQAQQLHFEIKGYSATVQQYDFNIAEISFDSAGARHGSVKQKFVYYKDTILLFEGKYEHGRLVDTARWYDRSGTCIQQASFSRTGDLVPILELHGRNLGLKGTLDGELIEWKYTRLGKLELFRKEHYKNGKLNGEQLYFSNGVLLLRTNYLNGKAEGPGVHYFGGTSKIYLQGSYSDGKRSGKWQKYSIEGKLTESSTYRNDRLHDTTFYYFPNGKVKTISIYKDGLREGDEWEYDSLGTKQSYRHFLKNYQDSIEIHFYPDGKIAQKQHFKNGYKNGLSQEYYPNGKLKAEGSYSDDWRIGIWKFFGPSGKLLSQKDYDSYPEDRIVAMDGEDDIAIDGDVDMMIEFADQLPRFGFAGTTHQISKDQKMKFLLKYEYIDVIANVDAAGNLFFTILTPMKEEQKTKLNKYLNKTFPKAEPANLLGRKTLSQTAMRIRISK